jgi:hypothetical protein|tara:strand:- start:32 stop:736 length:705 start_codon:yes stop_codon:yes gene_type:complete
MSNFSKSRLNLDFCQEMIRNSFWFEGCPVSLDRLMLLKISYIDFDGNEQHDGEMIIFDVLADHVLSIFYTLYLNKFPIDKIKLLADYNGDDERSMEDNNSSAFNYRVVKDSNLFSIHAYGMAIDINPKQNPCLMTEYEANKISVPVYPARGMEYINRNNLRPGMVENILVNDSEIKVVDLFKEHGFSVWGGNWNFPVDWHHFQVTRKQAEELGALSYEDGIEFYNNILFSTELD